MLREKYYDFMGPAQRMMNSKYAKLVGISKLAYLSDIENVFLLSIV